MSSRTRRVLAVADRPWWRFGLLVVPAALLWFAVALYVARMVGAGPAETPPRHIDSIEMRLVELPPPVVPPALAPPVATTPQPRVVDVPPRRPRAMPHVSPQRQTPQPAVTAQAPLRAQTPAQTPPTMQTQTAATSAPVNTPPSQSARAAALNASNAASTAGDSNAAPHAPTEARAIYRPLPDLPDDLRDSTYQTLALARFTIHADGSCDVTLVKPTSNPRLNQILLDTLKHWRFAPAISNDHAIDSTQDVRVHFNVD